MPFGGKQVNTDVKAVLHLFWTDTRHNFVQVHANHVYGEGLTLHYA